MSSVPSDLQPAPLGWPARYELLDGLRGIAALAVVLHHVGVAEVGHYAVMIFFVISGYCITASAESHLRRAGGFKEFMARRVRRIYPPYLLALLFFAATRLLKSSLSPQVTFHPSLLVWLQNATLTQWLTDLRHPIPWPEQNPTLLVAAYWSLNYEEQFYLVMGFGLMLTAQTRISLSLFIGTLAVLALGWNWLFPGNFIVGLFIEYWMHFALGAGLFFVLCRTTSRRYRALFIAGVLLIVVCCGLRILLSPLTPVSDLRAMLELGFLGVATVGLFLLRPFSACISASRLWKPIAALGTISYSLYLVHQFNLNVVSQAAHFVLPVQCPTVILTVTIVLLHILLGSLFWWACERPFLPKRSRGAQSASRRERVGVA